MDPETKPPAPPADETRVLLERILATVQQQKTQHWVQVLRAIVLSLAAFASTWSAYQVTRWNFVVAGMAKKAMDQNRSAAELRIRTLQNKTIDGLMALNWLEANQAGRKDHAEFLRARFSPDLKPAFEAWLRTDPLTNPAAPRTPLQMAEYDPKDAREAQVAAAEAHRCEVAGGQAIEAASGYVQLTLMFATVLFFCSLGPSVPLPRMQRIITFAALLVFVGTFLYLLTLPVASWH